MKRKRSFPSSVEVFDFDKNWHLVLPHLHDDKVERVLARSMSLMDRPIPSSGSKNRKRKANPPGREPFDPDSGPWSLSPDYWQNEAARRAAVASFHVVMDDDTTPTGQIIVSGRRAPAQFYPQPDTVEWYQAFGLCHWLAPWLREIGKRVYPQYSCRILSGDDHSLAYSADRTGNIKTIWDILGFRRLSAMELIEFATRKNPDSEKSLSC